MLTLRQIDVDGRLNQFLNDTFGAFDARLNGHASAAWVPPVDISEQADATRIAVEIPGVKPENLKVTVEANTLTIHGVKGELRFERSFTLAATVDASNITAGYEHGVLTVTLPKAEQAKPRQIAVDVAKR